MKNKILIILIIIVSLVVIGIFWGIWEKRQGSITRICEARCRFISSSQDWIYDNDLSKRFENLEQCTDYCKKSPRSR